MRILRSLLYYNTALRRCSGTFPLKKIIHHGSQHNTHKQNHEIGTHTHTRTQAHKHKHKYETTRTKETDANTQLRTTHTAATQMDAHNSNTHTRTSQEANTDANTNTHKNEPQNIDSYDTHTHNCSNPSHRRPQTQRTNETRHTGRHPHNERRYYTNERT